MPVLTLAQRARPLSTKDIKEIVKVKSNSEVINVEAYLEPSAISVDKTFSGAFFDVNLFKPNDRQSFYRALKVWERYLIDRPYGEQYFKIEQKSLTEMPITINEPSLIDLLIEYKVDRFHIFPDSKSWKQPLDSLYVIFYPSKEIGKEFMKKLSEMPYVLDCKIQKPVQINLP